MSQVPLHLQEVLEHTRFKKSELEEEKKEGKGKITTLLLTKRGVTKMKNKPVRVQKKGFLQLNEEEYSHLNLVCLGLPHFLTKSQSTCDALMRRRDREE